MPLNPARFPLILFTGAAFILFSSCLPDPQPAERPSYFHSGPAELRIATYNLEDVRTEDVASLGQPRLMQLAAVIQKVRPDILVLNEIAYDVDASGVTNADLFVRNYLSISQGEGLAPLRYKAFSTPSNTGEPSGFDLDNDGTAVTSAPAVPGTGPNGSPGAQTAEGRAYGNDAWGFGMFPGQYGMALLVREDLEILEDEVRTFRLLPWSRMPGALVPVSPESARSASAVPWYSDPEWESFRLSSKSHWDVPVVLPNGSVVHMLVSHPTPPAFDGPEQRNVRRNHDEIRFWADYLDGADYIADDSGRTGGLTADAHFVIAGDLNADPDEGRSLGDPIGNFLLSHSYVNGAFVPVADSIGRIQYPNLSVDDTAIWGMRVDYVLPSTGVEITDGAVHRPREVMAGPRPSDHFLVWIDARVER